MIPWTKILVLVESDQFAECLRVKLLGHDGIRGSISFEHLVRNEVLWRSLGFHGLATLSERQCLGLSEEVGHQFRMVVADGIVTPGEAYEVGRHDLRSLVQQLIEGVLPVRSPARPR